MSAITNQKTFGQALREYSSGTPQSIKELDALATTIIERTVRSSDPEHYTKKPFIALIDLAFRLNENFDLEKTPVSVDSILKLIGPNQPRIVFRT